MLTQAGYLTIRYVRNQTFYLGYPNREVAESMAQLYTEQMLRANLEQIGAGDIAQHLQQGNAELFIADLNRAFLALDYTNYPITNEAKCRALVSVFLNGAGLAPLAERHNALGRSELEVRAGICDWVMEFKFCREGENADSLLREALRQIEQRQYAMQQEHEALVQIAIVFSERHRQIVRWETLNKVSGH